MSLPHIQIVRHVLSIAHMKGGIEYYLLYLHLMIGDTPQPAD